jgi:hypothetical protein
MHRNDEHGNDSRACDRTGEVAPIELVAVSVAIAPLLNNASDSTACQCGPNASEKVGRIQICGQGDDGSRQDACCDVFDVVFHNYIVLFGHISIVNSCINNLHVAAQGGIGLDGHCKGIGVNGRVNTQVEVLDGNTIASPQQGFSIRA